MTTQTPETSTTNGAVRPAPPPSAPASSALAVAPTDDRAISAFSSEQNFVTSQRIATALGLSTLVPTAYRGKQNLPNVLIAMELASRIGCSVLMVMQNLDIIHGRPSWRATFLIATVNACGRFTPLRFAWSGTIGKDDRGCRAYAKDRESGEPCEGPLVTLAMAKAEGWFNKEGSKWKTLPELMTCYRAAAFWTRIYAPELSLGMRTTDEETDTFGPAMAGAGAPSVTAGNVAELEAELLGSTTGKAPIPHDSNGEVSPEDEAKARAIDEGKAL